MSEQTYIINKVVEAISSVVKNSSKELHEPSLSGKELFYLKNCLDNNFLSLGPFIQKFEKKISKLTGAKYVVSTITGNSALHTSLRLIKTGPNDEILIPTLHYISSVNSTIYCGAVPHFIDVEEKTLGVDCHKLDKYLRKICKKKNNKCINNKTGKTIKAIIVLHTFGHPANIEEIIKIGKKYNIIVIEDAAESIGSYYKNKHVGTFGKIGILSFNGNKSITTGGGGAILTNNKSLAKRARYLIANAKLNHPWNYSYKEIGYNYRMPNLNAALGYGQLKYLNKILSEKRKLFQKYQKALSKFKFLKIMKEPINCKSNYWLQTILLNKEKIFLKNKILKKSHNKKIKLRPVWELLHKLEHLKNYPKMDLSNAALLQKRIINLPSSCYKIK